MKVVVRADADASTGTGHLMRCLALAGSVRRRGGSVTFLSRCGPAGLRRRVEEEGHEIRPLGVGHPDASDLGRTLDTLVEVGARWLVADGYHFDSGFYGPARRAGYRVLAIDDDVRLPFYDVDALLNQNLHAPCLRYRAPEGASLLLGTRYALLRPEFAGGASRGARLAEGCRVLVTMGGGDADNVSGLVLGALCASELVSEITVVVGAANRHGGALAALAGSCAGPAVRLVRSPPEMRPWMEWADVVISASGTTCWELAATGSAALLVVIAENQWPLAEAMHAAGAARNLGWWKDLSPASIRREVVELFGDSARREREGKVGRALVDGQGAERVAALLLGDGEGEPARLRPAAPPDAEQLWRLANDAVVRSQSFSVEQIPLGAHLTWFADRLGSPSTRIWVMEAGGELVAQVRYDRVSKEVAEIDFAVVAARRGQGLGARILAETWREACAALGVREVHGVVLAGNEPSSRAFLKAGFREGRPRRVSGRACRVFVRSAVAAGPRAGGKTGA